MFSNVNTGRDELASAVSTIADGGLVVDRSNYQLLSRDERTPEAVAVVITKAEAPENEGDDEEEAEGVSGASPVSAFVSYQTLGSSGQSPGLLSGLSPSLVGTGHNSTDSLSPKVEVCPDAGWLRGVCEHGTVRWHRLDCKRRGCPVCGKARKHRIAWRIRLGVDILGGRQGAGWFVGTFDHDISKPAAVQIVGKMIRWLRKETGVHFEYASTWELTAAGRLHVNIIMAPWHYVPQDRLSAAWQRFGGGERVWIERVGAGVGDETAKAGQERIGNYMAKWDQMVRSGRGVTYSKGWPKLPDTPVPGRKGKVHWRFVPHWEPEEIVFTDELDRGFWEESGPDEYSFCAGEDCHCFDFGS